MIPTTLQPWVRHVLVPGVGVSTAVALAGRVLVGPLRGCGREASINRWCARHRTPAVDRLSWVPSTYADTPCTIAMSLAFGAVLWHLTRSRAEAVAPLAAITVETVSFVSAAAVVGRARPDVPRLDRTPPTSSFPSGHTGATTAMHLTLAHALDRRGTSTSRAVARSLRWGLPVLVAASRVYRGMHHPSDVAVGWAVGAWAARAVRGALGTGQIGAGEVGIRPL